MTTIAVTSNGRQGSDIMPSGRDMYLEKETEANQTNSDNESRSIHDGDGVIEKEIAKTDAEAAPAAPALPPVNPFMDPRSFPDGGLEAWLVVVGAMCSLFVSFGWINCIGIFQEYYQTHQLSNYSPSTVAWIPSLEISLMFLGGSWVGRLYDNYGPRYIMLIGSFLHVFGLMMASISTQYYQFLLAQGVCSPIGASMVFYPAFSAIITWFFHKRALAVGVAASGSSLGGVIFPIVVSRLVKMVGFPWTMRICAFLILGLLIVANLLVKSRIPPFPKPVKFLDFVLPLREAPFALLTTAMFIYFFGLFIPFIFLVLEAIHKGMSPTLADYLVSIMNAASIFGRTLPAWAGDKLGRFNVMTVMSFATAILVLALWIPASNNAAIIVFAALFGLSSGAIVSLAPAMVAQISDVRQIGVRTGTIFTFVAISSLVSSPIGGQLVTSDHGGYLKQQLFSGIMMTGGAVFFVLSRIKLAGFNVTTKV